MKRNQTDPMAQWLAQFVSGFQVMAAIPTDNCVCGIFQIFYFPNLSPFKYINCM